MDISKKKKTAIILGASAAVLATSAIITGIMYSKMNRQKPIDDDQKIIDAGISQDDNINQKPSSWDSKTEEKFNKLVKYAEALTRALKASSANARKSMSVQNLKNEIERLKNLIDKAEKTMPILDESITNLEKYKVKKDKLTEVRNELNKALNDAKDALDFANLAYNKMINNKSLMQSKINELIKLIDETIKKSQSAVYQKQIKSFIDKLTDCNNVGDGFVKDAERLNLETEKTNLIAAIKRSKAEIKRLEELLKNPQSEEQKKEALKKAIEQFEKDVNEIVAKVDTTTDLEDMKDLSKQIDELKSLGKDYKNDAEQLGLNDEANKVNEAIKKLEDAKTKIEQKIAQKEQEVDKLKKDVKKLLKDLDVAMGECINAKTIDEFDAAISKLAKLIADGETLLTKTKEAKLVDETSELETKLERAKKVLEQTKEKRDAKSKIVDEWKTKINDEINALKAKVDATKNANTIATLEPALKELENAINHANGILSDANNFEEKTKIQAEINQLTQAIADANTEKQTSAQRLEQLKNINAELVRKTNEAIQKANAAIEEAKNNQNSDDKSKLETIITNLNDAKTQLDTTKTEVSQEPSLVKQIEDKTTEVNEWITKISDQKQKVEQKEAEIAQKKQDIDALIKELDKKQKALEEASKDGDKNKINEAIKKLEEEIDKAKKLHDDNKNEPKLNEDNQKLQDKIDESKQKINDVKAAEELKEKQEKAKEQVKKAEEDLEKAKKKAEEELGKSDPDLKKLEDAKKNLDKAVEDAKKAEDAANDAKLPDKKQEIHDKIDDAKQTQKNLNDKIDEINKKNLNAIKKRINDTVSDLQNAINDANSAISDTHNLEKVNAALGKITTSITNANDVKQDVEAHKEQYLTEFNKLQSKIEEAIQKQSTLQTQKTNIEKERAKADEEFNKFKEKVNKIISDYEANNTTSAAVKKSIQDLEQATLDANVLESKTQVIAYNALLAKISILKSTISTNLAKMRLKLSELEDAEQKEEVRIAKLKKELDDKAKELDKAIKEIDKKTSIDEKESAINALKTKIDEANTLNDKIVNNNDQEKTNPNYNDFKGKLDEATTKRTTELGLLNGKKQILEGKVNAFETKVQTTLTNADNAIASASTMQMDSSIEDLKKLIKEGNDLKSEISSSGYQQLVNKVVGLIGQMNSKIEDIKNAKKSESERINGLIKNIDDTINLLNSSLTNARANQNNVDRMIDSLSSLNSAITTCETFITDNDIDKNNAYPTFASKLSQLKTKLSSTKTERDTLQTNNNAKIREITDAIAQAKTKNLAAIANVNNAANAKDINQLNQIKNDLTDNLIPEWNNIQTKANSYWYNKKNSEITAGKTEAENLVSTIEQKITEIRNAELAVLKKQITDTINDLDAKITPAKKTYTKTEDVDKAINALQDSLNKARNLYSKVVAYSELSSESNSLNNKIVEAQQAITTATNEKNRIVRLNQAKENAKQQIRQMTDLKQSDIDKAIEEVDKAVDENEVNQIVSKYNQMNYQRQQAKAQFQRKVEEAERDLNNKYYTISTNKTKDPNFWDTNKKQFEEVKKTIEGLKKEAADLDITNQNDKLKELSDKCDGYITECTDKKALSTEYAAWKGKWAAAFSRAVNPSPANPLPEIWGTREWWQMSNDERGTYIDNYYGAFKNWCSSLKRNMGTYASYPTTSVNEYNAIAAKATKYAGFFDTNADCNNLIYQWRKPNPYSSGDAFTSYCTQGGIEEWISDWNYNAQFCGHYWNKFTWNDI